MNKAERRAKRLYYLDEASIFVFILIFSVMGQFLRMTKQHHFDIFSFIKLASLSAFLAVGSYAGVHTRFDLGKRKAPYWKRLYAGLSTAFGSDFFVRLIHG